jgi:hypothetical protein
LRSGAGAAAELSKVRQSCQLRPNKRGAVGRHLGPNVFMKPWQCLAERHRVHRRIGHCLYRLSVALIVLAAPALLPLIATISIMRPKVPAGCERLSAQRT